ncbi:hypothetical protein J4221_02220 [Candidatus Pacearchaeota archaeon]|nr:hypothetical protein [Candidatus Pacearchaeota archaeon]
MIKIKKATRKNLNEIGKPMKEEFSKPPFNKKASKINKDRISMSKRIR